MADRGLASGQPVPAARPYKWTKLGRVSGAWDDTPDPLWSSGSLEPTPSAIEALSSPAPDNDLGDYETEAWDATSQDLPDDRGDWGPEGEESNGCLVSSPPRAKTSSKIVVELALSTLNNPRSMYDGFNAPAPPARESEAVAALLQLCRQDPGSDDFVEFTLSNFTIYLDSSLYPCEMRPLHQLSTRRFLGRFYFDGVLSVGQTRFFIKKAPFQELPIGNYGASNHTVGDQIWIRSELNHNMEIYYKLETPSVEYARFFRPFVWIVDLAKHVIDFCSHMHDKKRRARLHDFKDRFSTYLCNRHHRSETFTRWYAANGSRDFRSAVATTVDFIWKEAAGLLGEEAASWHHFWLEILGGYYESMAGSSVPDIVDQDAEGADGGVEAVKHSASRKPPPRMSGPRKSTPGDSTSGQSTPRTSTPGPYGGGDIPKTIVTPYIYGLFSHMGFDTIMQPISPSKDVLKDQADQIYRTRSTLQTRYHGVTQSKHEGLIASIQPGDVISTPPDKEETGTKWKRETSKHYKSTDYLWYGLVQQVHTSGKHRSFDVIWMYQPRDTPCALMKYPWQNELFLSDSCTCETARVDQRDVLGTHRVAWFGQPITDESAEFFVRQTYLADERCWVSLKEEHLTCGHRRETATDSKYEKGDTVLAGMPQSSRLDVFVVDSVYSEHHKRWPRLRRLLRRHEADKTGTFPPNELVYSDQLVEIHPDMIDRHCLVRAFSPGEEIPVPFNRNGTGDAFFMTHRELLDADEARYVPIEDFGVLQFKQSPDISRIPTKSKLRGLDLFCGGGNFGRGIEDGGAVEMRWANDLSSNAMHTYMANCDSPEQCKPYLGSVDTFLEQALRGNRNMPRPGEVQFIAGGSPCQGFSRLTSNHNQKSLKQEKNRSLIASFASCVDLYRDEYGLLENVQSIVKVNDKRGECFFSQLVCAIVGLGYQVRIIYADAWSYGSPQGRERMFLSFAAPGVTMPKAPALTHSHPPGIKLKGVGMMSNGMQFGKRIAVPTPFKFVSAAEAVDDLPDIQDGKADYCVGFPDHRISIGYNARLREQLRQIPFHPYGMNHDKIRHGYVDENGKRQPPSMTDSDFAYYFSPVRNSSSYKRTDPGAKGWGRVHPHGLFRTVVTTCSPSDGRTGHVNHWRQPRPLTILEVRRAQGFPDEDIILGKPADKWHIVGNSVARQVALALGMTIREAWFGSLREDSTLQTKQGVLVPENTCAQDGDHMQADVDMHQVQVREELQAQVQEEVRSQAEVQLQDEVQVRDKFQVHEHAHGEDNMLAKGDIYTTTRTIVEQDASDEENVYMGVEAYKPEAELGENPFYEQDAWVEHETLGETQAWVGQEAWIGPEAWVEQDAWVGQEAWVKQDVAAGEELELSLSEMGGSTPEVAAALLAEDAKSDTGITAVTHPQDLFSDVPKESTVTRRTSVDVVTDKLFGEEELQGRKRSHSIMLEDF